MFGTELELGFDLYSKEALVYVVIASPLLFPLSILKLSMVLQLKKKYKKIQNSGPHNLKREERKEDRKEGKKERKNIFHILPLANIFSSS